MFNEWRANASFDEVSPKHGRFCWMYALVMPHACCSASPSSMMHPNPSYMLLWSLVVVCVQLIVGALEFAQRASLAPDDGGRYGGAVSVLADVSTLTWLCSIAHALVRFAYCVHACNWEPRAILTRTKEDMPIAAKVARFCVTFYVPTALVEVVAYAVFAGSHHSHSKTASFFAMTCVFALCELLFTSTHLLVEHLPWVLLVGLVYAFPISLVHYAVQSRDAALPYIYGCVDWSHPLKTFEYITGLLLATSAVYAAVSVLCTWKNAHAFAAELPEEEGQGLGSQV